MIDTKISKLGDHIRKINQRFSELTNGERLSVYGVTNKEGVVNTGVPPSDDLSNYIVVGEKQFVYNPYRVNVGSIGLTPKGFLGLVSPAYVVFETKEDLDPEFLFLYLKSERGNNLINHYGNRGGVRDALRFDALTEIDIPITDLPTQKEILARLQSLQALHREANEIFTRLKTDVKRLRQSTLQQAIQGKLVDYNPAPGEKTGAELLADIRAEKERRAREAGKKPEAPLPPVMPEEMPFELPEGWVWCRGEEIADFVDPQPSHRTPHEVTKGVPYIAMKDVRSDGSIDFSNARKVSIDVLQEHQDRYTLSEGDFVIGKIGTLGNPVKLPKPFNYTLSANLTLVKPKPQLMNWKYLYHLLSSPFANNLIESQKSEMSYPVFGIKKARSFPFPLPPLKAQNQIVLDLDSRLGCFDQFEEQFLELRLKIERLWKSELQQTFKFETNG